MTPQPRNIVIFRDTLLPFSETFIVSQGEALSRFRAFYVGSRKIDGIAVPSERSFFVNDGTRFGMCREALFKVFDRISSAQLGKISSSKPCLIHAHFGPDGVLAQTIAKRLSLPLVVTFHGFDASTKDEFVKDSFYTHRKYLPKRAKLIKGCSLFIAVSEFIKGKLLEQGFPEEKIVVHYIGIDTDLFKAMPRVARKPVVLFVGRLVEVKGCSYLIRAMQKVQAVCPDAELVIIGDGPLRGQLEQEARDSLKSYRFLGRQPSAVVREWMNRSRVFCVPSATAKTGAAEAFGIVFAEAQAMGLPVVTFASGGIPEAVADGETGFLLPERDWQGLADRIHQLFGDDVLWERMSRAAQERVTRKFNLKMQVRLLEELYSDLLRRV